MNSESADAELVSLKCQEIIIPMKEEAAVHEESKDSTSGLKRSVNREVHRKRTRK